jgi:hypothetical protein
VDTYADVSGAHNEHWNLMAVGDGSYRVVKVNSGLDLEGKRGEYSERWCGRSVARQRYERNKRTLEAYRGRDAPLGELT